MSPHEAGTSFLSYLFHVNMSTKKLILLISGAVVLAAILYMAITFQSSDKEVADYVVPELQLSYEHRNGV